MSQRWVLCAAKEPLVQADASLEPPARGHVQLALEACGLGLLDWNVAMLDVLPHVPLVLGAEAVGRVTATGADVPFQPGQRVGLTPLAFSCGRCEACSGGLSVRCEAAQWHGLTVDGGLTHAATFRAQHLVSVPDEVDAGVLAATLGSGWTALAAVDSLGAAPRRVGVLGLGGVGHQVALYARAAGHEVLAEDLEPARAAWATSAGLEAWEERRVDACVVCTPSQQGLRRALRRVRSGGQVLVLGQAPATRLDLPLGELVGRQLRLEGSFLGSESVLQRALAAVTAGRIVPVVHEVPFEAVGRELYALRDLGFVGRMVVRLGSPGAGVFPRGVDPRRP